MAARKQEGPTTAARMAGTPDVAETPEQRIRAASSDVVSAAVASGGAREPSAAEAAREARSTRRRRKPFVF